MPSPKSIERLIRYVEGFGVHIRSHDGTNIANRRVEDYPYERAANRSWTVARWRQMRFNPSTPSSTSMSSMGTVSRSTAPPVSPRFERPTSTANALVHG
jgi:hypothetical protein